MYAHVAYTTMCMKSLSSSKGWITKKKKRSKKAKNFEPKPKAASFSGYKNIWIILDQTLKVHMVGNKKKITINKIHILILR